MTDNEEKKALNANSEEIYTEPESENGTESRCKRRLISPDKLKAFARFEITVKDICSDLDFDPEYKEEESGEKVPGRQEDIGDKMPGRQEDIGDKMSDRQEDIFDSVEIPQHYRICLDDLENAVYEMNRKKKMSAGDFVSDWLDPLFYLFYDALEIEEACNPKLVAAAECDIETKSASSAADCDIETESASSAAECDIETKSASSVAECAKTDGQEDSFTDIYHLPDREADVISLIMSRLEADMYAWYDLKGETIEQVFSLSRLKKYISYFEENKYLPAESRKYTKDVKRDFINSFEDSSLLENADELTKSLYRRFVDELSDKGDLEALRIKAYACYGGNAVYECDWKESCRCLKKLLKNGYGPAANSLGYIYYYGRLNGKTDYKKAFKYFSIGCTYGIYQSFYKIADMYTYGHYVPQNIQLAHSIVTKMYEENMRMLCRGDMTSSFADLAYRMGNFWLERADVYDDDESYLEAYTYYLEAEYAIKKRIEKEDFYGDDQVLENIRRGLEAAAPYAAPGKLRSSVELDNPDLLTEFADGIEYCRYSLKLDKLKSGKCKITLTRLPSRGESSYKSLVAVPYISSCTLTDKFTITAAKVSDIWQAPELVKDKMIIDEVNAQEMGEDYFISFLSDGKVLASLNAAGFIYKKPGKGKQ